MRAASIRLEEAETLMQRVVEIMEKSLGADHPNVAVSLNNLATLLKATNRLEEAEPLMQRALEIFGAALGTDHPSTKTVRDNYELLLRQRSSGD